MLSVIEAADDDVDKLWPQPAPSDIPIINLPGAHMAQAAAANAT